MLALEHEILSEVFIIFVDLIKHTSLQKLQVD